MATSQIQVQTKEGVLRGERAGKVTRFRGVAYAEPPVGALPFRAPQPVSAWSGVREATRCGFSAPQPCTPMLTVGEQDEDCLTLNVWTSMPDGRGRPVMVRLHGGGHRSAKFTA